MMICISNDFSSILYRYGFLKFVVWFVSRVAEGLEIQSVCYSEVGENTYVSQRWKAFSYLTKHDENANNHYGSELCW